MYNDDGSRKDNKTIYGKFFDIMATLAATILAASLANLVFIFGGPARRFLIEQLKAQDYDVSMITDGTPQLIYNVLYHGKHKTFVILPHPEYILRWASQEMLDAICNILDQVTMLFGIRFDLKKIPHRTKKLAQSLGQLTPELELQLDELVVVELDTRIQTFVDAMKISPEEAAEVISTARRDQRTKLLQQAWSTQQEGESTVDYEARQGRILKTCPKWVRLSRVPESSSVFLEWQKHNRTIDERAQRSRGTLPNKNEDLDDLKLRHQAERQKINLKYQLQPRNGEDFFQNQYMFKTGHAAVHEYESEQQKQDLLDQYNATQRGNYQNRRENGVKPKWDETAEDTKHRTKISEDLNTLKNERAREEKKRKNRDAKMETYDTNLANDGLTKPRADYYRDIIIIKAGQKSDKVMFIHWYEAMKTMKNFKSICTSPNFAAWRQHKQRNTWLKRKDVVSALNNLVQEWMDADLTYERDE